MGQFLVLFTLAFSILRRVQAAGAGAEGDVHAFGYFGIYSGSGTMPPQSLVRTVSHRFVRQNRPFVQQSSLPCGCPAVCADETRFVRTVRRFVRRISVPCA
jgi:hypothetical protein